MVKNAEVAPLYWYDFKVPDASTKEGRGELSDWIRLGYVSRNYTRSVTRTIEFSYDDFALSVVAKGIGNDTAHEKYLRRSANGRISGTTTLPPIYVSTLDIFGQEILMGLGCTTTTSHSRMVTAIGVMINMKVSQLNMGGRFHMMLPLLWGLLVTTIHSQPVLMICLGLMVKRLLRSEMNQAF